MLVSVLSCLHKVGESRENVNVVRFPALIGTLYWLYGSSIMGATMVTKIRGQVGCYSHW